MSVGLLYTFSGMYKCLYLFYLGSTLIIYIMLFTFLYYFPNLLQLAHTFQLFTFLQLFHWKHEKLVPIKNYSASCLPGFKR